MGFGCAAFGLYAIAKPEDHLEVDSNEQGCQDLLRKLSLYQSRWCYSMTGDVVSYGSGKKIIPLAPISLDGFCIGNGEYLLFQD